MKKRVYIIGQVTGLERHQVEMKFNNAAVSLEIAGYDAVNPVALVSPDTDWQSAMRICIMNMVMCDYVFLLSDWKQSKGATIEVELAKSIGINFLTNIELCKKLS